MTKAQKANKNLRNENCAYKVSDRNKDTLGIRQRAIHDILAKMSFVHILSAFIWSFYVDY